MRLILMAAGLLVGCSDYDLHRPDKTNPPEDEPEPEPEDTAVPDEPDINLSPSTLDFGYLPKDCLSEWTDVLVSNGPRAE